MQKKNNWQEFKEVLEQHNIRKLYHFTDRDNLKQIIENGGLYSWADCAEKGIDIPKPGGSDVSRELDRRAGLHHFVRTSFVRKHPMQYVAMNDGRISNPVLLEIDPEVIFWSDTQYSDCNAAKNGVNVGSSLDDFKAIHFDAVKENTHFDLPEEEQPYFQAEVLVKNFIPLQYITNISDFGIPIPENPTKMQSKNAYTALITRDTPTAFIFLLDHSISMNRKITLEGENMTMADALAKIVNAHVKQLVQRCVKYTDIRHYFDIALIGYGENVYSAWKGRLEGRWFVSPKEIYDNPYETVTTTKVVRTRKGETTKEVTVENWIAPRCDGSWTHLHLAFDKAKELLEEWLENHKGKYCYPPTIINITDGEYNHISDDAIRQKANELQSMATNDGNVILINIHVSKDGVGEVLFPINSSELNDKLSERLFNLSSLLPLRYNDAISSVRGDTGNERHKGLSVNAGISLLPQLMEIGTPTNIQANQ